MILSFAKHIPFINFSLIQDYNQISAQLYSPSFTQTKDKSAICLENYHVGKKLHKVGFKMINGFKTFKKNCK